jgi:hypothetical protein
LVGIGKTLAYTAKPIRTVAKWGAMRWLRVGASVIGVTVAASLIGPALDARHTVPKLASTAEAPGTGEPSHLQQAAHRSPNVQITLEKLLGHHVVLAIRMMRAQVGGAPDLVHILEDALGRNTAALTAAVRSIQGARASQAFRGLWTDHNVALIRYAEAVATDNQNAEDASKAKLDRYRRRFGKFAESVTGSRLDARRVARSLETHIDQLLEQTEAYAAGDYATSYRLQRVAYAHMFPAAKQLGGGSAGHQPGEFPVHLGPAAQKLRSALALLLGEHVELLVDTTRAGLRGMPEFDQAAAALNDNTRDLSEAFAALVGERKAQTFNDIWSDHIDLFVDYTIANAGKREAGLERARRRLQGFQRRLGGYLARVTGSRRGLAAVREALAMHDDLLLRQIDAFAEREYGAAHRASYHAYQDMFSLATKLSGLIATKVKKVTPAGGAQTGGGGTASDAGD